jgi:two-component system sensor histidine kinase KdpD
MLFISIMTSALTTKIMQQESIKAESEKERMRANLLRAVSHDLRTPLTTIYGSSCALIDNMDTFSREQELKMLNGIKEDSDWLITMVENLLSITKIDSGQVRIIKSPTVLEELVDAVIVKFKKRHPDQNIDISIPDDMIIIPMDALLIQQVLINIMENAVHHAVGMTRLNLDVNIANGRAVFEVSDDGCGIDPAKLNDLFKGTNLNETKQPDSKKRNAGIGLSVCSSIINAHSGEIYAKNAPNGGAVIGFVLNIEEETNE